MKHELKYAVLYEDGTWAGLFSTKAAAVQMASKRLKDTDERVLGIFAIAKGLTSNATRRRPSAFSRDAKGPAK